MYVRQAIELRVLLLLLLLMVFINNIDTVKICQSQLSFKLLSSVIKKRAIKFETSLKYA